MPHRTGETTVPQSGVRLLEQPVQATKFRLPSGRSGGSSSAGCRHALSRPGSCVGGAHSRQVSEAGFRVEGQHDALSLQRVRRNDQVMSPPGHSSPADVRDQPRMAGSGRFGVLKHIDD
jgi:hypothetical protein